MASYREILVRAWPLVLANSAVPLLGLADTAIIGNFGSVTDLGAIAFGALIFSFVYWSFGFLRMGTTGFAAQAVGADNFLEVRAVLGRALLIAALVGVSLLLLQVPIRLLAFSLLGGSEAVEDIAQQYFNIRIWGAPATLATFSLVGLLIGLGKSGELLRLQLFLNGLNITLDFVFAGLLSMGAAGIAMGTVIAEWCTVIYGWIIVRRQLSHTVSDGDSFWPMNSIVDREQLGRMLTANWDIMIRTLLLVFSFAYFTDQSSRFGDVLLAANHVLLQLISFSAFFLDGYAFVVEALAGRALGAGNRKAFILAAYRSTLLAGVTALVLAGLIFFLGPLLIALLTDLESVNEAARGLRLYAAIYVVASFMAFQLDGIFIGVSFTREMRQAAIYSLAVYLLTAWLLIGPMGVPGLWWAMIVYVIARALSLLLYYGRILKAFTIKRS